MIGTSIQSKSIEKLTAAQKWRLGFGFALIYLPMRIYMNLLHIDMDEFLHKLPLWIMELTVSVSLFTLWIDVIERLQQYVSDLWSEEQLEKFKFFDQLFTVVIAIGLAAMFNYGFRILWHYLEALWENQPFEFPTAALDEPRMHRRRANTAITVISLMGAYYLASNKRANQKLQQVHLNEERLEKENVKAHFSALKNQVSPHFLFNNFSVLTTLVETNPSLSVEFINRLSKAYRYILEQSDFDYIKLATEIEFLETYMFLLNMRFEDKLSLNIQVSQQEMHRYSIVPLTLQLLVENAVKHNKMSSECPLRIKISMADGFLQVSNPLKVRELSEPSTKLGLQNIINRYRLLVNKPVLVTNENSQFVVKIPLIQ